MKIGKKTDGKHINTTQICMECDVVIKANIKNIQTMRIATASEIDDINWSIKYQLLTQIHRE